MAETLRPNGADHGTNGPAPLSEDEFLTYFARLDEAESDLGAAMAGCKAPRKAIKDIRKAIGERMDIEAFDRARVDRFKPGSQRETEDREYRRNMAWLGKPVGLGEQAAFDFSAHEPGVAELHSIDGEGHTAGAAGHPADTNTYSPGTERFARYQTAWARGHEEFMAEQTRIAEGMAPAEKRAPGRPKGRRNKKAKTEPAPDPGYEPPPEGEQPAGDDAKL